MRAMRRIRAYTNTRGGYYEKWQQIKTTTLACKNLRACALLYAGFCGCAVDIVKRNC